MPETDKITDFDFYGLMGSPLIYILTLVLLFLIMLDWISETRKYGVLLVHPLAFSLWTFIVFSMLIGVITKMVWMLVSIMLAIGIGIYFFKDLNSKS